MGVWRVEVILTAPDNFDGHGVTTSVEEALNADSDLEMAEVTQVECIDGIFSDLVDEGEEEEE
jgi:hypothetical protein